MAELLVRAVGGDAGAEEALVDLAMSEPLAERALVVVLELQVAAAERSGGLPQPAPEVEARLEEAARSMVEADD